MKKVVLLLVMLFLSSARAVGEDLDDQHELNYWADWSDGGEQNQEKLPFPFEHFLQRIARRPRPQQFYGLMGKRDAGYSPASHKRYKTDSFVGLMGKRSLNSVMETRFLSIYENQQNGRSSTCLSNYQYINITFPRPTSSRYVNMNSQNSRFNLLVTAGHIVDGEQYICQDLLNGVPCKCLKEDANETVFPLSIEMFK